MHATLIMHFNIITPCMYMLCNMHVPCITFRVVNLRKYDHVSAFYHRLNWLPLPCFIQFRLLCLMYRQYHFKCIPLEPPIVFGGTSPYCTRTPVYFANIPMFRLSFPQQFFRFRATQWWNSLPSSVTDCLNSPFHEYADALRQYCR